ncbi:CLUMA_CG016036, isoform A [Clunio marinus]|uniref:CLUMA_CG016036, isoform A n=1 Tax=Clunio marinus TaxID=568069 RepID=A0A1J1IU79_9DIPT|nr:CLUMA_CG016036, isoform A [Clunio marinus]
MAREKEIEKLKVNYDTYSKPDIREEAECCEKIFEYVKIDSYQTHLIRSFEALISNSMTQFTFYSSILRETRFCESLSKEKKQNRKENIKET